MTESLFTRSMHPVDQRAECTPDELVAVAREMRPVLRKLHAEHEALGGYSAEIHQRFHQAGFYRVLQPKKFGGLEFGLDDFFRIGIEISRGDPGVGWSYILGTGHSFHVGAFFDEEGQRELFSYDPFIAPGRTVPAGRAVAVDGGYRLSGTWDYCSGAKWSTALLVVAPTFDATGNTASMRMYAIPRRDYTLVDDWGGDRTIGMRASSSNSITVEDAFVPEHLSVDYNFREHVLGESGTVGYQLHGNPLYLGRTMLFFNAELIATQIGAAWAALDEYESLLKARPASFPPRNPRTESPEYHRWFGRLRALTDSAESLYLSAVRQYLDLGRQWVESGREFTPEEDARLRAMVQEAAQLAISAVDLAFSTAGSSAAKRGSALEKYYRDVGMYKTHIAAQWDVTYGSVSRYHFGQPLTF